MRDVIVLASGGSVAKYNLRDLETRGHLIAVNGCAAYTKPHVAVTMDRLVAENLHPLWQAQGIPEIWIFRKVVKNFLPGANVRLFENGPPHDELNLEPDQLAGENSGFCAFNLAVHLRPQRIFLLGFDMGRPANDEPNYWHPGYVWSPRGGSKDGWLADWAEHFNKPAQQCQKLGIQVYSVNHQTRITAFPVISFQKFLEMTNAP